MLLQTSIASRLRRLARVWTRPPEGLAVPPGWQTMAATDPADIFLVAYPKSGMTWLQAMVAGATYGLDPAQAPDSLVQDLVPDVHYKSCYKRYRTPMFFKSHHLPRPEYRRVVYLLRDGRDVMVSYCHHLRALNGADVDFGRLIDGAGLFPCKWHEHVEQWMANPYGASMLTILYEDLRANAGRELARLCDFVGEPREPDVLRRVAEQCCFAAMRRREERFGWDNPAWPKDRPFVRRGEAGSYRDEMPADLLERFVAQASAVLRTHYAD
jgi:hypothetical protein